MLFPRTKNGYGGGTRPRGSLKNQVIKGQVGPGLSWHLKNRIRPGYWGGWLAVKAAKALTKITGIPTLTSQVAIKVFKANGQVVDYGVVGYRVVTTAGVEALVDAFQNTFEPETFNFHGIGTGTNAEAVGDTSLQTELTTEYNPDSTRATGSQGEGATADIYQTVGTNSVDASVAITEHGIFTQAATGGGTLLDRTVFTVINLTSGDSLQSTYELTINDGG